ncbi:hypothetical protein R1sor_007187 [Riccia sorocarpa]|uniref:Endonuclease/exonuclease/phosphatase domain-containing protein n=1 Tax=Riccia sorocarpa TaxID=122646 RepID=A0ABD3HTW4_9MARC
MEGSNIQQVMHDMEGRLRSYVDAAKESQRIILTDHENERLERTSRALNLRVVGLPEEEHENVKMMVTNWMKDTLKVTSPRIIQASRVGRTGAARPVLLRFASLEDRQVVLGNRGLLRGQRIWLDSDLTHTQIEERKMEVSKVREAVAAGFVAYMRNDKAVVTRIAGSGSSVKGRGFGGIAIWSREGLSAQVCIEVEDPGKQYLALWVVDGGISSFLMAVYFAPWGAKIYGGAQSESLFMGLTQTVLKLRDIGPVYILGDFNSRVGSFQGTELPEDGDTGWRRRNEDASWQRRSVDQEQNRFAEFFEQFVLVGGLTILNGSVYVSSINMSECG